MTYDALGVHCFAGAFTYGMGQAGFRTPVNLESSNFGVATAMTNNPYTRVARQREDWMPFVRGWLDRPPHVVYGNPACSCWSPIGRSTLYGKDSWRTDPNLQQTVDLVTMGDILRPQIWMTESVPNFERRGAAASVAKFWLDRGYACTLIRHDIKFFGVPQQRRRVMLVAHAVDFPLEFPPFHGVVPVGAVLEGVKLEDHDVTFPLYPEYVEILKNTEPGQGLLDALPDNWTGRKPRFVDHKVHYYNPTGTIVGSDVYYHPVEPRKLTLRETQLISGYPESWKFIHKSPLDAMQQLGKTVLPEVGRWIGDNAYRALAEDSYPPIEPHARIVVHWGKSQRIKDSRLLQEEHEWDLSEIDATWLEDRVRETSLELRESVQRSAG